MRHDNPSGAVADSFGNMVAAITGLSPPIQENGGMPYLTSTQYQGLLGNYLANFPGHFVTLNLGTNDAESATTAAQFYTSMATMVQQVIAAGKIPVVPTPPWTCDTQRAPNMPTILAAVQQLYTNYPQIIHGPDLYSYFSANQSYIQSNDCVHPNAAGQAIYRQMWATLAAGLE